MKPIHTLTWAVSAPFLLFAGASHAINVSDLVDPGCAGTFKFDSAANKIMCAAVDPAAAPACTASASSSTVTVGGTAVISATNCPTATSWAWNPDIGNVQSKSVGFDTEGLFTYTVIGSNLSAGAGAPSSVTITVKPVGDTGGASACATGYVAPTGTRILDIGTIDYYANKDFDSVFDSAGSTFSSVVGDNEIRALKFTDTNSAWGFVSLAQGTMGGSGYKDISISTCPGNFDASLGIACLRENVTSTNMYYSTNGSKGCQIPLGMPIYLNVRATPGKSGSGFLLQNVIKTPIN
jgi:hypothetical protein